MSAPLLDALVTPWYVYYSTSCTDSDEARLRCRSARLIASTRREEPPADSCVSRSFFLLAHDPAEAKASARNGSADPDHAGRLSQFSPTHAGASDQYGERACQCIVSLGCLADRTALSGRQSGQTGQAGGSSGGLIARRTL